MNWKKALALILFTTLAVSGCSAENTAQKAEAASEGAVSTAVPSSVTETASPTEKTDNAQTSDSIVVWFSLAGEQYAVGEISKGNTAIIAEMIQEKTGSDAFEIVPVNPYPTALDELFSTALEEQEEEARPDYEGDVTAWDAYDTVYLGYPLWYDDMPMIIYHFLEDHDFTGKTVCPFDTSGGEGLLQTVEEIRNICDGAEVSEGLTVLGTTAQNDRETAEEAVEAWLAEVNPDEA